MYFDSNIFIFAAIDKGKLGKKCREIMKLIDKQKISAAASYIVIDEVLWVLKRKIGKDDAIKIAQTMLSMPVKWIRMDESILLETLEIFERTTLDPRDSIHISSMKNVGLTTIVSEDRDFDKVEGIERINASECLGGSLP
ncbi:MAG: type II toxin-antitoxin system VapC family toxin [Thermoplasmata archaeon]